MLEAGVRESDRPQASNKAIGHAPSLFGATQRPIQRFLLGDLVLKYTVYIICIYTANKAGSGISGIPKHVINV